MEGANISFLIYKAKWIKLIHCLRKQKEIFNTSVHIENRNVWSLGKQKPNLGESITPVSLPLVSLSHAFSQ